MDVSPGQGRSNQLVLAAESPHISRPSPSNDTDPDTSTDTSTTATPIGSNTPTGAVLVPGRDRSGTVIGRPIWDEPATATRHRTHRARDYRQPTVSPTPSTDTSRPETETEDDGDVDMDRSRTHVDDASPSPEPRTALLSMQQRTRRAVGIVSDAPPAAPLQVNTDAHIIINDAQVVGGDGVGVEDGIVSLEPNDDFAMGAPPGAPGAIDEGTTPRNARPGEAERRARNAPDVTPRAGTMNLPPPTIPDAIALHGRPFIPRDMGATAAGVQRNGVQRTRTVTAADAAAIGATGNTGTQMSLGRTSSNNNSSHHRDADSGPYRDEDVLLSLQLLAYLSKYPHVRQAFYKSRVTFHPASANLPGARQQAGGFGLNTVSFAGTSSSASPSTGSRGSSTVSTPAKELHGFFRTAFGSAAGRGKEKEKAPSSSGSATISAHTPSAARQTNVFSLVERFTFRPSSTETDLPNPPPKLPPEIQYWAGVIMRNACRKDESRGGIRQCANSMRIFIETEL